MSVSILTENTIPKISKAKSNFNIFRVVDIKKGKLEIIELFGKDGVFRGVGKSRETAFKKAYKVAKNFYKEEKRA